LDQKKTSRRMDSIRQTRCFFSIASLTPVCQMRVGVVLSVVVKIAPFATKVELVGEARSPNINRAGAISYRATAPAPSACVTTAHPSYHVR